MAQSLRFDGRVAIVTGAGGGLGKTYALDLASRGCAVVVNDLGGSRHGEGGGSVMADQVVNDIRSRGGKAVANYDSVEFGEKIVKTAIDNFGRIDIVINNAGILRDKSFQNMTDMDWDLIQKVHLRGAYSVTKAAWPYMQKQQYGRVIMTSSNSGVYGNFGQANYSAAKLGLVGLSNTLAREGDRYGIQVNALVPTAGSRLTQTAMPEEFVDALEPKYVTPMTVYLVHESCDENGGIWEAAGGWFGQIQLYRSEGVHIPGKNLTAEQVRDNWTAIVDMQRAQHFDCSDDVTLEVMSHVMNQDQAKSESRPVAASRDEPNGEYYNNRDVILYALGVGAGAGDLKFVYEGADDFSVLPTFFAATGLSAVQAPMAALTWGNGQHNPDPAKILHGEQYVRVHAPLPTEAGLRTEARVVDVLDKGSGAAMLLNADTFDAATGTKLSTAQFNIFQLGSGNFNGPRSNNEEVKCLPVPNRAPDAVVEQKTSKDQAAIYRLSGDLNPLHIDPQFASLFGFKQPVLHGLCSFGFAVRHVLERWADNDTSRFRAVKARFSKPVLPGQTLRTETWLGDNNRVHFQTKVKETGDVVIANAWVELTSVSRAKPAAADSNNMGASSDLKSTAIFNELSSRLKETPEIVTKVKGVFLWVIKKDGKEVAKFTCDLKNGKGAIYAGEPKDGVKAATTLTLDDGDMEKMVNGKLNPQQAFMTGKLKLKGNIMLTQKLQALIGPNAKL